MNKIKFRTWDSKNKKMYYPDRVCEFNDNNYCIEEDGDTFLINGNGEREYKWGLIAMQEIQLYQTKIYVGDIVDITIDGYLDIGSSSFDTDGEQTFRGTIVYSNYAFGIELEDSEFMYLSTIESDEIIDLQVVGNIYEDPNKLNECETNE